MPWAGTLQVTKHTKIGNMLYEMSIGEKKKNYLKFIYVFRIIYAEELDDTQ